MSSTHITSKDITELFAKESSDNTVYCDINNNPIIDFSIVDQEILKPVDCESKNSD